MENVTKVNISELHPFPNHPFQVRDDDIESNDPNIKAFEKVARKYGVDYAIKKVKEESGRHKYIIFFKGRDNDAITSAFREYTAKAIEKAKKPSILKKLKQIGEQSHNKVLERAKDKQRGQTR